MAVLFAGDGFIYSSLNEDMQGDDYMAISDRMRWLPKWVIEKYDKSMKLYAVEEIKGNLLLNEGITEALKLIIGDGATAFNNANTYIGVGNGTTAESATQTGLSGANKKYVKVDSTYPQVSGQKVVFRATFGPNDANYDWREYTVANGNSDSAKNLNRKVENHGTKAQGDTWVVQLEITLS